MPAMPKDPNTGRTELQEAFIDAYISNGGKREKAALAAGYAKSNARMRAWELLKRPDVLQEIHDRTSKSIKSLAPKALGVMLDMMNDSTVNASIRFNCAREILDRAGYKAAEKLEISASLAPELRRARLKEIEAERAKLLNLDQNTKNSIDSADNAQVIDVEDNQ